MKNLSADAYLNKEQIRRILPSITDIDISQALETLSTLKGSIIGRVCGDVGDNLTQYLTIVEFARTTGSRNFDSLEIGTLFGGSCLTKLFAMRNSHCQGVIFCIDPMTGHLGHRKDPTSGIPVNSETFFKNIRLFGFSEHEVKSITAKSCSSEILKLLQGKLFATLLIDGDHSYSAVKYDWIHYHKYIIDRGFVLFDDYNEPRWPEVSKFVNQEITKLPFGWKMLGRIGTTGILKYQKTNK